MGNWKETHVVVSWKNGKDWMKDEKSIVIFPYTPVFISYSQIKRFANKTSIQEQCYSAFPQCLVISRNRFSWKLYWSTWNTDRWLKTANMTSLTADRAGLILWPSTMEWLHQWTWEEQPVLPTWISVWYPTTFLSLIWRHTYLMDGVLAGEGTSLIASLLDLQWMRNAQHGNKYWVLFFKGK